jgi:hypothetical protein
MKKLLLISLVVILLSATVVPAMAGSGSSNGQGNSTGVAPGNSNGGDNDRDQERDKDQLKDRDQIKDKDRIRDNSSAISNKFKNQAETKWMFAPFYLQGIITAVDAGAYTLTVNVVHANAKVKAFMGNDLSITGTESTQIFQITQGGEYSGTLGLTPTTYDDSAGTNDDGTPSNRIPITFDQLVVGQKVAVHGKLVDTIYTARLITAYIGQPIKDSP